MILLINSVSAHSQTPNLAMVNNGHHYGWDKNQGNGNGSNSGSIPGMIQGEYFWNEENRLISAVSNGRRSYYLYNASGERTVKWGEGETLYVSQYYQLQNQTQVTKHIFVGTTRIVSKLSHYNDPNSALYDSEYEKQNIYTYHPDHLGSSNIKLDEL